MAARRGVRPRPIRRPADVRGLRVTVMGLGTKGGGVEVVKFLVRHGARVTVTDEKTDDDLRPSLEQIRDLPVTRVLGGHRAADFARADIVIQNPGVPADSPYLKRARDEGVAIETDIGLFFLFCPAPIAGVTGTRGKTTAVTVAGMILRAARDDVVVAGNIQRSPLADIERIARDTPVVLELSSWQLEGLEPYRRSPHWAVLTSLLPDHLNRYPSFDAYVAAKETIFRYQGEEDTCILSADDARVAATAPRVRARVLWVATERPPPGGPRAGEGIVRSGERVALRREGREELLPLWREIRGVGDHTRRNMLFGALLAIEMGADLDAARQVLRTFPGVPHRLETVRDVAGRTFVNDSAATIPEAVVAALRSYPGRRVALIAGGTDKNLDFAPLAEALSHQVRSVVLLDGSGTEKLRRLLGGTPFAGAPVVRSMGEAVRAAVAASRPGDAVLLSPGAASFELFRDEFDRGEQFRAAVRELREDAIPPG